MYASCVLSILITHFSKLYLYYCKQCLILLYCKFEPSQLLFALENKNLLFYRCRFVYIIKRTLHCGLRYKFYFLVAALVRKILFCHSKRKFISSRHRVISSIYLTHINYHLFSCRELNDNELKTLPSGIFSDLSSLLVL